MAEAIPQDNVNSLLSKFSGFFGKRNELEQKNLQKQKIITEQTAKQSQFVQQVSMKMEVMAGKSSSDLFNSGVKELSGGFIDLDSASNTVSDKFQAIGNILNATLIVPIAKMGIAIKEFNSKSKELGEGRAEEARLTKEISDEEQELLELDKKNKKNKGKLAKDYNMDDKKRRKQLQLELPEKKKNLANLKENNKRLGSFGQLLRGLIPSMGTLVGVLALVTGLSIYFLGLERTIEIVINGFRDLQNMFAKLGLFLDDIGILDWSAGYRNQVLDNIAMREAKNVQQTRSREQSDELFDQGYQYSANYKDPNTNEVGPAFVKKDTDGNVIDVQKPDSLYTYIDDTKGSETFGQVVDSRTGQVNEDLDELTFTEVLGRQGEETQERMLFSRKGIKGDDAIAKAKEFYANNSKRIFEVMLARKQYNDIRKLELDLFNSGAHKDPDGGALLYAELVGKRGQLEMALKNNEQFFNEATGMSYAELDQKLPKESLDNETDPNVFNKKVLQGVIDLYQDVPRSSMFLRDFEKDALFNPFDGKEFSAEGFQKDQAWWENFVAGMAMSDGRSGYSGQAYDSFVTKQEEGTFTVGTGSEYKDLLNPAYGGMERLDSIVTVNGENIDLMGGTSMGRQGNNTVIDNSNKSQTTVNQEPPQPAVTDMSVKESALNSFNALPEPMPWD